MARISLCIKTISISFLLIAIFTPRLVLSAQNSTSCATETNSCTNKKKSLPLKIIAIFSILITSVIGVSLPLVSRSIKALQPDRNLFVILKCFAAGIILATGFMHVLPDSFDMLWVNDCLSDKPWHDFPFTGFVAMLSALFTLMVDSMATSIYGNKRNNVIPEKEGIGQGDEEMPAHVVSTGHGYLHGHHHHHHNQAVKEFETADSELIRYRVVAMVLELGIVVHSVVIGLSLGASNNTCSIKGLVAALCFHQMFEGMGLGGCILQAEYNLVKKLMMVFFFSVTTPFGIALGIGSSNVYEENSPSSLITVGLLNASSAGLLIYMALVDLLSAEFMGRKLQGSIKLQIKSYVAVLLGAGAMSLMAKWA